MCRAPGLSEEGFTGQKQYVTVRHLALPGGLLAGLPELDEPGWTSDDFIRDFPVDFTLVLENVADPDHGIFAHQTPIFDSFAASAEYPMQVSTEPGRGGPKVCHPLHFL